MKFHCLTVTIKQQTTDSLSQQTTTMSSAKMPVKIETYDDEKPFFNKLTFQIEEKLSKIKRFVTRMFLFKKKNFFVKKLFSGSEDDDVNSEIYSDETDSDNSSESNFHDFSDSFSEYSDTDYYCKLLQCFY